VDLFFLVDSIAQCSRGLKGEVLVVFKLYVFVVYVMLISSSIFRWCWWYISIGYSNCTATPTFSCCSSWKFCTRKSETVFEGKPWKLLVHFVLDFFSHSCVTLWYLFYRFWGFGWKDGFFLNPLFAITFGNLIYLVVHLLLAYILVAQQEQKEL
jgi:hypothetical protein